MTLELVPWRGANVPVLNGHNGVSRSFVGIDQYAAWLNQFGGSFFSPPPPTTLYGQRPAEPISYSFQGFVEGMLYADGPVAAVEAYRLRVFSQAPLLYQEIVDGRAGKFVDDERLDALREPWPGGTLGDLMKRSLVYGDFAGNAFILDVEDELVVVRPDWVQIVLERREFRGGQVGWRQKGILYFEGGLNHGDGVAFLPGEYAHFIPGLPDPLAVFRGMSWLTPLIREVKADKSAGDHKVAWFENSASANLAISLPKEITPEQFKAFVAEMDAQHKGAAQAGKTLYTAGGADVTVIGSNMVQADFSSVVGRGETRIASAGGCPPVLLSFSEGMQGSSLNTGNYQAAKRNFVDTTMRDLWANWCSSLAQMDRFRPGVRTLRLWYDGRDIPFLHEDARDLADIQSVQATAINQHITAGFEPSSARDAVAKDDLELLVATGMVSVQLAPPGQGQGAGGDQGATPDAGAQPDSGGDAGQFGDGMARAWNRLADVIERAYDLDSEDDPEDDELERRRPYRGQRWRHGWLPVSSTAITEVLTPDEAARDYGDELDRVEVGDASIVARDQGTLTVQTETSDGRAVVHAAPSPAHAEEWAGYIDDGLDLEPGESTEDHGLIVARTEDGLLLRWPEGDETTAAEDMDGVDLTDEQVPDFTQGLRDMAYETEDHQAHGGEEDGETQPDVEAGEGELPAQRARGFDSAKHPHYGKGVAEGKGGEFRPISALVGDALKAWVAGGGHDPDPLKDFKQPQLRKAAEQLGLNPPKGMRLVPLKGLLMQHARGGKGVDVPETPAVAKKAATKVTAPKPDLAATIDQLAAIKAKKEVDRSDRAAVTGALAPLTIKELDRVGAHFNYPLSGTKEQKRGDLVDFLVESRLDTQAFKQAFKDTIAPKPAAKKVAKAVPVVAEPKGSAAFDAASVRQDLIGDEGKPDLREGQVRAKLAKYDTDQLKAIRQNLHDDVTWTNMPRKGTTRDEILDDIITGLGAERTRPKTTTAPKASGSDAAKAAPGGRPDLDRMPIPQLRAHAKANGIPLGGATKKADILAAIKGGPAKPDVPGVPAKAATHPDLRPDGSANPSKVRQALVGMEPGKRQAYLDELTAGMNQTKVRALAKDLGVPNAGRADREKAVGLILDHFDPQGRKPSSTGGTSASIPDKGAGITYGAPKAATPSASAAVTGRAYAHQLGPDDAFIWKAPDGTSHEVQIRSRRIRQITMSDGSPGLEMDVEGTGNDKAFPATTVRLGLNDEVRRVDKRATAAGPSDTGTPGTPASPEQIDALVRRLPSDHTGMRASTERILEGRATEGGVPITSPYRKARMLRIQAGTHRRMADESYRAVPTPSNKQKAKEADRLATQIEAIADLLSPPRSPAIRKTVAKPQPVTSLTGSTSEVVKRGPIQFVTKTRAEILDTLHGEDLTDEQAIQLAKDWKVPGYRFLKTRDQVFEKMADLWATDGPEKFDPAAVADELHGLKTEAEIELKIKSFNLPAALLRRVARQYSIAVPGDLKDRDAIERFIAHSIARNIGRWAWRSQAASVATDTADDDEEDDLERGWSTDQSDLHPHAPKGSRIGGQFVRKAFQAVTGGTAKARARQAEAATAEADRHQPEPSAPVERRRGKALVGHARAELAQAQTIAEVNSAATAEASRITGRHIPFEFEGLQPQLAREYSEGILRGLERFPNAPLGAVRAADFPAERDQGDFTWAHTRIHDTDSGLAEIEFNRSKKAADSVNEILAMKQARGVFAYGDAAGLALHEFGHVLHEHHGTSWDAQGLARKYAETHTVIPPSETAKRRFRLGRRKHTQDEEDMIAEERRGFLLREISFYSTSNAHEMAAEAFADVMANGHHASPLSLQIMKLLEAQMHEGAAR